MSQVAPDGAPHVRQLLAFYREAGVVCALTAEPVNRLADPDAALAERAAPPTQPAQQTRTIPAALPLAPASAPPTADAAIAPAREAARTAPTLEALRELM